MSDTYDNTYNACEICKNLQKTTVNKPVHFTSSSMAYAEITQYSCKLSMFKAGRKTIPDFPCRFESDNN